MIWWIFKKQNDFEIELNQKIQLVKGLAVKYEISANGSEHPKMKLQVWLENNHYQITNYVKGYDPVLIITRNKKVITLEIQGEKRTYYLKTPLIWRPKKLK